MSVMNEGKKMRVLSIRERQIRKGLIILAFVGPAIVGLLLFQYWPLLNALRNSFYNLTLLNPERATFAGFDNYLKLLHDPHFLISIKNTFLFAAIKVFIQIPIAMMLALVCRREIRGIGLLRTAAFAPVVTAMATVSVLWNMMYHPENGLLNSILPLLGIARQPFITSATQALPSIVIMTIWKDAGFTMLILLGGLQGIPEDYYQAAAVDGANWFGQLRYITLPLIKRTMLYAVILTTIDSFRVFTPIYIMTKGGPEYTTTTTVYYIYESAFKYLSMGYASAIAVILMLIMIIVALVQARLLRTEFQY
jgi:ABC-type sugar transport system permease subunit